MTNFTKTLITPKGTCEFTFTKVESAAPKFFVQVEDHVSSVASFEIKKNKEGKWKVLEPAPQYILLQEEQLVKAIEQYLASIPEVNNH